MALDVPSNYTEKEVIDIIQDISKRFGHKMKFGYYTNEDIQQEAAIFAMEALKRYRPECGSLDNFLWIHVRNRLLNLKRDKYRRSDKPCNICPFFSLYVDNNCEAFRRRDECSKYHDWQVRNTSKSNLVHTIDIDHVNDNNEKNMRDFDDPVTNVITEEMLDKITEKLDMSLRADYLRLLHNGKIPKSRQSQLFAALSGIIYGAAVSSGEEYEEEDKE